MHMADALLSPAIGVSMCAVSAGAVVYSVAKINKDDLCEKKVPVMGVMGAFVFAAQMINFTIPATGSSGHIGGGILLAAVLGGFPAFLSITAVLFIQCLFFADGGLLALGCNIFNMGIIPCLIIYPLVFKPIIKNNITALKMTIASISASIAGLQLGSFCVVLQTQLSGVTELPFSIFVVLMQPIHLAIGIIEGIITAAILAFVYKMRPEIIESASGRTAIGGISIKNLLISLAVITLIAGGALSLFASPYPDGLEWSMEKAAGTAELETNGAVMEKAQSIQEAIAFMPDYGFKDAGGQTAVTGTSAAGIIGGALTFLLAGTLAFIISNIKKKYKQK